MEFDLKKIACDSGSKLKASGGSLMDLARKSGDQKVPELHVDGIKGGE